MARPETRTWYRIALARPGGGDVALVAASGEHMGEAIAAAEKHVKGGWPIAADNAADADIPLGESVGKGHVVELGTTTEATQFHWPVGVLPLLGHTEPVAGARIGFGTVVKPDLFVIEAQTEADKVVDLFLGLIEKMPSADNLEIRVLDHFDSGFATTDVWLTSRIDAKKILRFLDDHDPEMIGNGHLELAVYARAQKGTLRLTEHKTVMWVGADASMEDHFTKSLGELGVPRVESLITVQKTRHFHYRPATSRSRDKLSTELYRHRLRKVDTVRKAQA